MKTLKQHFAEENEIDENDELLQCFFENQLKAVKEWLQERKNRYGVEQWIIKELIEELEQ